MSQSLMQSLQELGESIDKLRAERDSLRRQVEVGRSDIDRLLITLDDWHEEFRQQDGKGVTNADRRLAMIYCMVEERLRTHAAEGRPQPWPVAVSRGEPELRRLVEAVDRWAQSSGPLGEITSAEQGLLDARRAYLNATEGKP